MNDAALMAEANLFGINLIFLSIMVIAVVAVALERLITIYLSRLAKRVKLERNADPAAEGELR